MMSHSLSSKSGKQSSLRQTITQRAELLRQIRSFFDQRDFVEVTPPCLLPECIVDASIEPIRVKSNAIGKTAHESTEKRSTESWFLQTSPELAMKGLLAAGSGSIYTISPVFRGHEWGTQHRPEFSMLEWYEVGANAEQGIATLGTLAMQLFQAESYDVQTYRSTFQKVLGIDPIEADLDSLNRLVQAIDLELAKQLSDDRDDMLDVLLSHRVQPVLGMERPFILCDYPLSQAALAKPCENDPACAARFELFYQGIELANGYDELLDADTLCERTEQTNSKRIRENRLPIDSPKSLVTAMRSGLPASAGVAMGVDRVLMIRCEMEDIGMAQWGWDAWMPPKGQ